MKTVALLCLLCALVCGQILPEPCETITEKDRCTNTQGRCNWGTGTACDGTTYGWCRSPLQACLMVVTCAMNPLTAGPMNRAFTFSSSCIPPGWVRVNASMCQCNRPTCDPPCGNCEVCSPSGTCVSVTNRRCSRDTATADLSMICPPGYECQEDNCRSVCVPSCSNPVNCLIDPCEAPRPQGCDPDAICVSNYCGGCNRNYYDPRTGEEVCNECEPGDCVGRSGPTVNCSDGTIGGYTGRCIRTSLGTCAWEYKRCSCPPLCRMYCEFGFKLGPDGCPICECNDPPCNTLLPCAEIRCERGYPIIKPGDCCPTCSDPCDGVECPAIRCAPGYISRIPPGGCCPVCFPVDDCSTVRCAEIVTCPPGFHKVRRGCCDTCEPQVPCELVLCAQVACEPGYKAVVPSGECCPKCEPIPDCTRDIVCPAIACPTGTHEVVKDLECCPTCEPTDRCLAALCPLPNCRKESWITRYGECCPQCPQCRDTPDGRILCTRNDDSVCRAGYTAGDSCSIDIPASSRREVVVGVKLCRRSSACEELTTQEMRLALSTQSSVDDSRVFVNALGQDGSDSCCYRYTVSVSGEVNDGFDVNGGRTSVVNAIEQNPDLTLEEDPTTVGSVASTFTLSIAILLFSAFLLL